MNGEHVTPHTVGPIALLAALHHPRNVAVRDRPPRSDRRATSGDRPGALLHRRRLALRASGLQEILRRNGLARDDVARREQRLLEARRSIVDQAQRLGESMQEQWATEPTSQSAAGSLADPDASRIPNQPPVSHVSKLDLQARITNLRGAIADDIERELAIFGAEDEIEEYLKGGTS